MYGICVKPVCRCAFCVTVEIFNGLVQPKKQNFSYKFVGMYKKKFRRIECNSLQQGVCFLFGGQSFALFRYGFKTSKRYSLYMFMFML